MRPDKRSQGTANELAHTMDRSHVTIVEAHCPVHSHVCDGAHGACRCCPNIGVIFHRREGDIPACIGGRRTGLGGMGGAGISMSSMQIPNWMVVRKPQGRVGVVHRILARDAMSHLQIRTTRLA